MAPKKGRSRRRGPRRTGFPSAGAAAPRLAVPQRLRCPAQVSDVNVAPPTRRVIRIITELAPTAAHTYLLNEFTAQDAVDYGLDSAVHRWQALAPMRGRVWLLSSTVSPPRMSVGVFSLAPRIVDETNSETTAIFRDAGTTSVPAGVAWTWPREQGTRPVLASQALPLFTVTNSSAVTATAYVDLDCVLTG